MRATLVYASIAIRFVRSMSTSPKIAALAQFTSANNKFTNLVNIAQCASQAKSQGAVMLFLPECFGFIGSSGSKTIENAEDLDDTQRMNAESVTSILESTVQGGQAASPTTQVDNKDVSLMDGLRTIARASNLWISGGGIHESIQDKVYNTDLIINEKGNLVQKYRKIHLFDVSIPGSVELKESHTTRAGDAIALCESPVGMLGLSTCYDVRFPEQYTELVKQGAQVILVPAAFTVPTGSAHWHVLLRGTQKVHGCVAFLQIVVLTLPFICAARAIETQCYVLAAAQVGRHNEKRESYGHTLAVDPWGDIVADAMLESGPTIVTCAIDLDKLADIRLRMPIQQHRKATEGVTGL